MNLRNYFTSMLACLAFVGLMGQVTQAVAQTDSTDVQRAGALPPSNCPNVDGTWYAAGQVPSGYFKSNGSGGYVAGNCYPLPGCGGGTAWNSGSQTCASICSGGQVWNGASCACTGGTVWNGSTCGTPPSISASASPTSVTVGAPVTLSWSASTGSVAISCSGAANYSSTQAASGSVSVSTTAQGTLSCSLSATNSYGTAQANTSASAACGSGTAWNGSSCASVCSGGTVWNGSSCVCPAGQVWNGSTCGTPPAFGSFRVSPASQRVGANYDVSWSTGGSGVSVAMNCTGANPVSYGLSPASGGSGAFAASRPGTTRCTATASNAWGSTSWTSSMLNATCPSGTIWNGSSCAVAATPQGGLNGKVVNVNTLAGFGSSIRVMVLTGLASSIRVDWYPMGGSFLAGSCTLTAAGQTCSSGSWGGNAVYWHPIFRSGQWGPEGGNGSQFGRILAATLNSNGSITFTTYGSGGSHAYRQSMPNAYQDSSIGTLSKAQIDAYSSSATFQITDWLRR